MTALRSGREFESLREVFEFRFRLSIIDEIKNGVGEILCHFGIRRCIVSKPLPPKGGSGLDPAMESKHRHVNLVSMLVELFDRGL